MSLGHAVRRIRRGLVESTRVRREGLLVVLYCALSPVVAVGAIMLTFGLTQMKSSVVLVQAAYLFGVCAGVGMYFVSDRFVTAIRDTEGVVA